MNETVALDPKHPQPHLLLSQIYFRMGDEAKAKDEKEISLRLRRENPTILEAVQGRPFPVDFRSNQPFIAGLTLSSAPETRP